MPALDYANASDPTHSDIDDPHAYRFKPSAWRFIWVWWNVALLGVIAAMVLVALLGYATWADLKDAFTTTAPQIAPLALVMSILIAHGKVDLSLYLQTTAAGMLFQWLAWTMDFNNAQHLTVAIGIVVLATSLVGLLNWCLCTLLKAPSAITTLLVGGVASLSAMAIGTQWDWSQYRPGPIQGFVDVLKILLRWSPFAMTLAVTALLTVWLVVRRIIPPVQTQARRESGAELVGFVLVSVVCASTAVAMAFDASSNLYVASRLAVGAYNLECVLAAALIGGTLFSGKLVNPVGAVLGVIVVAAFMLFLSKYFPAPGNAYWIGLSNVGAVVGAGACVVLAYSSRFRSLLGASSANPGRVPFPLICAAAAAVVVLAFAIFLLPLIELTPDKTGLSTRRSFSIDRTPIARVTLCLACIAATTTYLLLFTADLLLSWRNRAGGKMPPLT